MGGGRGKLLTVARLYFNDRTKYGRSCLDCRTYVYDEDTGRREIDRTKPGLNLPMYRGKRADPPCHECAKTAGEKVRHYTTATDPPGWAYRTFRHWRECAAVGWQVPEAADRIVRRNAVLFAGVEDAVQTGRAAGLMAILSATGTKQRRR